MKKFTAILAASVMSVIFGVAANAQISASAGYGLASHTQKGVSEGSTVKEDPQNVSGLWVNGSYDWEFLSKNWGTLSLQPGLTYSFYNKKLDDIMEFGGGDANVRTSFREHYLDIPVNVKYSYNLLPGTLKLSAYAGPVFSFGLSSKIVAKTSEGDDHITMRMNMYNGNTTMKGEVSGEKIDEKGKGSDTGYGMFDLKLGLGITATLLEKFDVKIGYNIGLVNRLSKANTDDSYKLISHTNVFMIGVGYNF